VKSVDLVKSKNLRNGLGQKGSSARSAKPKIVRKPQTALARAGASDAAAPDFEEL
jgi:hypothetical protein